ncbi:prephenate dehydrogenase/arogenate dehydrogenase family protein [Halorhodospira neutriphila]|uniref:Prephenate dehydrogenase n=1 Tax=Halorhodospira neutriphila TaxID=168379 RepID=A0ABS1E305_9GAMM|nr:prephenate dehydrogenase [Halorhodospira neutriphila]
MIQRLAVIGVGLIGGSLALALRRAGAVAEVVGCDRAPEALERAAARGVIDRGVREPAAAVAGADVAVIGVPVRAVGQVLAELKGAVAAGTAVTDVASVKGAVLAEAEAVYGEVPGWLVPGHPIAGTEYSGVEAAFPELYERRRVILTPVTATEAAALARVRAMWEAVGSTVVTMPAEHHDEVLAATSHLPHALAYALVDSLSGWDERQEIFEFAAGGFRDFTRIASSDPQMWRDICAANRANVVDALRRYQADVERLTERLAEGDDEAVLALFRHAQQERARFLRLLEGRS